MMADIDDDGGGTIDEEEFTKWVGDGSTIANKIRAAGRYHEAVQELFTVLDETGTGSLGKDDVSERIFQKFGLGLSKSDADKAKKVSYRSPGGTHSKQHADATLIAFQELGITKTNEADMDGFIEWLCLGGGKIGIKVQVQLMKMVTTQQALEMAQEAAFKAAHAAEEAEVQSFVPHTLLTHPTPVIDAAVPRLTTVVLALP